MFAEVVQVAALEWHRLIPSRSVTSEPLGECEAAFSITDSETATVGL